MFKPKCKICGEKIKVKKDKVVFTFTIGLFGKKPTSYVHSLCYRKHFKLDDTQNIYGWYDVADNLF